MVPTYSNSREHESSRTCLMAQRVGALANSGAREGVPDHRASRSGRGITKRRPWVTVCRARPRSTAGPDLVSRRAP